MAAFTVVISAVSATATGATGATATGATATGATTTTVPSIEALVEARDGGRLSAVVVAAVEVVEVLQ